MKFVKKCLLCLLKHLGYAFAGLGIWAFPFILIFLARFILGDIENVARSILTTLSFPDRLIYPGVGISLLLILFYITGIIMIKTSFLGKIPALGILFGDKKSKVLSLEDLRKLPPCLFLKSSTCPSPGWILSEMGGKISGEEKPLFGLVNVYYPNTPSLITGQVYPVRKETVIKIGNSSREIINLLLYAIRTPENITYMPWEDESDEEFKERAKNFGINLNILE